MNSNAVNSSNMLINTKQCIYCDTNECSTTRLLENGMYPIYEIDPPTLIGNNITRNIYNRSIDINIVVLNIPRDILIKIYNDYIRPHKYYQLFKILTINTIFEKELFDIYIDQFIKHFKIFVYNPIKNYIMRIDTEFNTVMSNCSQRGYISHFSRIPNIKKSIFIELLMYKYH